MAAELYLHEDCIECIFKFLDHSTFKSLSILSKQFLSITNRLRFSLTIYDYHLPFLPRLFHRFSNLTSLDLTCFIGDRDALLIKISFFPLQLKSLNLSNHSTIPSNGLQCFAKKIKTLTSLICSNIVSVYKIDFIVINDCFPLLEELDLSFPEKVDQNIDILQLVLPKLRKINLSGNYYINDSSLFHLCKNCELLEEVVMFDCEYLTHVGIASAIYERPNLKSFSISFSKQVERMYVSSKMIKSLRSLKGLTCLNLSFVRIFDYMLSSLAEEGLPLKRLTLGNCMNYSYDGIFCLLSKYRFLQHLNLQNSRFLNDQHVAKLSLLLVDLVSINLSHNMLTNSALFALARNCPSLSEIKMESTHIGKMGVENSNFLMDFVVNPRLKFLYLGKNTLRDENIIIFASIFPNLELLDFDSCYSGISEVVVQLLKRSCKIRHLNLARCLGSMKLLGMNFEVFKLEVLNLSHTKADDETLNEISKSCHGLLQLDIENCGYVTKKGVTQVVEKCRRLREINLRRCYRILANQRCYNAADDVDFLINMVLSRSSLRKIITPYYFRLSDNQCKFFLDHICLIC